ncbi:MAG: ABC transporter substrate-binding protein [Thermodesulfobacteriota bacterium]|nr:ABC transporter substrate-binding protein [Thermodesulfobacteriota bacterium]
MQETRVMKLRKNRFFYGGRSLGMENNLVKRVIFILPVLIFILFLSGVPVDAEKGIGVTAHDVKIGGLVDFTGPLADTYKPLIEAARIYFRNINDQGGVHGRKIKHLIEDDRYSIPAALSGFKKLVFKDKVLSLVPSGSGLGHTHALIPLVEKHKIPSIAATSVAKYLFPARRYIFSPLPFYEDQVKLIFEYITEDLGNKNPKIAIAYPDVGSGKVTLKAAREQAELLGIKLLGEAVIPVMAGDCSSQVINLKRLNPEYIIIHGYVANTVSFLRTAKRMGLSSTFIVIQYGCSEETVRIAGDAAKNMIGINCFGSWHNDNVGMKNLRDITLKYKPGSKNRTRNYMQGWFVALLVHLALENAGRNLDGEAMVNGFEKIKGYNTKGICGVIGFSPTDHKAIDEHRIYKADVEKNILIPLTGWRRPKE